MTLNEAIMQLVEMRENSMMPDLFKPYFDKVIETISKCVEPSEIPKWTPCSERLPEEDVEVLVTNDAGGITTIEVDMCGMYEDIKERFWYYSQHVIAWMPLPEPYQKGADE